MTVEIVTAYLISREQAWEPTNQKHIPQSVPNRKFENVTPDIAEFLIDVDFTSPGLGGRQ